MTTMLDEVFFDDKNIPVVLTCKKKDGSIYDISSATDKKYRIERPGGVVNNVTANFVGTGTDGQLIYILPTVDTVGTWEVRAFLTFPGGREQKSSKYNFKASNP